MKVKCATNYVNGQPVGTSYSHVFTIGKIYQFYTRHYAIVVFGDDDEWISMSSDSFESMFVPA